MFYVISLYWAMATALTIGYGDLTPNTPAEKMFVSLVMLLSSVLYASIFGQVTVAAAEWRCRSIIRIHCRAFLQSRYYGYGYGFKLGLYRSPTSLPLV